MEMIGGLLPLCHTHAMALDQSALIELLEIMRSADENDLMRRLLGTMLQALVDAEASAFIGAEPHERTRDPDDPAQRHPRQDRHDHRWGPHGEDPEGPDRVVLPGA